MPRKKFKCPKCDRSFSMAAHLARHKNTTHATGTRKKATKKRRGRRPGKRTTYRAAVASGPASAVSNGAARLLDEMQSYLGDLAARQVAIQAEIEAVTSAMNAMGGSGSAVAPSAAPRRGRPKGSGGRAGSLKDYIQRVLRQSPQALSPRDIATAVKKSGYKTKAKDLTKAVSNMLPTMKNVKRVGFGSYRM